MYFFMMPSCYLNSAIRLARYDSLSRSIARSRSRASMMRGSLREYATFFPKRVARISPQSRKTFRWRDAVGWLIFRLAASSFTVHGFSTKAYSSKIRVGSARDEQISACSWVTSWASCWVIRCVLIFFFLYHIRLCE